MENNDGSLSEETQTNSDTANFPSGLSTDLSPSTSTGRDDSGHSAGPESEPEVPGDANQNQQKIKFLINVPMEVCLDNNTKEQFRSQCQSLLTLLENTGFSKEDKTHLRDVAIVIGLNGKHSPELKEFLKELKDQKEITSLQFAKITYTWGPEGDIKYDPNKSANKKGKIIYPIPYRKIREHLKDHKTTRKLVRRLRGDEECQIYFSFVDSDTKNFNKVFSSYLNIVRNHNQIPTVMSTGYAFPLDSRFAEACNADREVRIMTAAIYPLGTYYPEPNFCVLLEEGKDRLTEKFVGQGETMESSKLIRAVSERADFTAVFANGNPIITTVPPKWTQNYQGLLIPQSHVKPYNWATSAYTHQKVRYTGKPSRFHNIRKYLMAMIKCEDGDTFAREYNEFQFPFSGNQSNLLYRAVCAFREYRLDPQSELVNSVRNLSLREIE